jgi:hypothetical protein
MHESTIVPLFSRTEVSPGRNAIGSGTFLAEPNDVIECCVEKQNSEHQEVSFFAVLLMNLLFVILTRSRSGGEESNRMSACARAYGSFTALKMTDMWVHLWEPLNAQLIARLRMTEKCRSGFTPRLHVTPHVFFAA